MSFPCFPVVLCGGAGTRLWPLSRQNAPKPFLEVAGKTLLAHTLERLLPLQAKEWILVSNAAYQFLLQDEALPVVHQSGVTAPQLVHQILEPVGKNTAAAIALAAHLALSRSPDAVLLVCPADHLIQPVDAFVAACQTGIEAAAEGHVVCFGIQPTSPNTGFGYIQAAGELSTGLGKSGVRAVKRFVEKPDLATAQAYVKSGEYFWNCGLFAMRADLILQELASHASAIADAVGKVWQEAKQSQPAYPQVAIRSGAGGVPVTQTSSIAVQSVQFPADRFATIPEQSIDYAVLEHSSHVAVCPVNYAWSDIGSWSSLANEIPADNDGNRAVLGDQASVLQVASHNTFVSAQSRMVATVGVEDLVVIESPDAVLVAHRDRDQEVKQVVAELKRQGSSLTEFHTTVHRPWGTYTVLEEAGGYKIKRIEVKPGASLSLQMHHHRSEHWIVVSGTAKVTNGEETFLVRKNESTYIPAGNKHRLENPGRTMLVMIEVQSGDYLEEDDIVRFEDTYGRA